MALTRYCRFKAVLEVSAASDYSNPRLHKISETNTAAEWQVSTELAAATGGTSFDASLYDAANNLLVENLDGTNFVTVVYRTNSGSTTDQTQKVLKGDCAKITDFDPATAVTITADTAAVDVRLSVW